MLMFVFQTQIMFSLHTSLWRILTQNLKAIYERLVSLTNMMKIVNTHTVFWLRRPPAMDLIHTVAILPCKLMARCQEGAASHYSPFFQTE